MSEIEVLEVKLVQVPAPWLLIGGTAIVGGLIAAAVVFWLFRRPK
jgi:hypothetical protein